MNSASRSSLKGQCHEKIFTFEMPSCCFRPMGPDLFKHFYVPGQNCPLMMQYLLTDLMNFLNAMRVHYCCPRCTTSRMHSFRHANTRETARYTVRAAIFVCVY